MMNSINFQTLESSYSLSADITREIWFITNLMFPPIRREVYKAEDGSVIAFRDSGIGIDTALYIDKRFMDLYMGEPEMDVIMSDQGIIDRSKIKLFRMEG